ncbi:GPW/gp25 family protein [Pannus brasiliensis CCIBt3594]|uniref:GPW/gp25 family protein n=1 Tax=Pannus brasiliensis CCIBt3594 TaxID=1427578 RepID=A0AAW9QIH6_9CHRO
MSDLTYTSFLGTGWSFPPEFIQETGKVVMISDERDIESSLRILFGTAFGERFLNPKYGLDTRELVFDLIGTTEKTALLDRVRVAIAIYEPRIDLLSLDLDTSAQNEGRLALILEYKIQATNSRYNLVYPFSTTDSNEVKNVVGGYL